MPLKEESTQTQGVLGDGVKALDEALRATSTAPAPVPDRRQEPRQAYQVSATLEPVSNGVANDVQVVTRDADPRGTGYVSTGEMPEGARAVLHLPTPDGRTRRIECRVRRSREIGNGLFEGSVEFFGEQPQFSDTRIKMTPARR